MRSYALWRIYCGKEGIAVQTTFESLHISAAGLGVYPMDYGPIGAAKRTPTRLDLVTKKRLMFDYEKEVRVVLEKEEFEAVLGHMMDWTPLPRSMQFLFIQKLMKPFSKQR
jgi:hypothetical protein